MRVDKDILMCDQKRYTVKCQHVKDGGLKQIYTFPIRTIFSKYRVIETAYLSIKG